MKKATLSDRYWDFLLKKGRRPKSVYAFAKKIKISEADFYHHFSSFKAIETQFWQHNMQDTINVLHEDEEYASYPADQKILAFFYTFISHIQQYRSRYTEYFPKMGAKMDKHLKGMKHTFSDFAKHVVASGIADGTFADRKKLTELYDRVMWFHFLAIVRFYLDDESDGFQKTDAFIEKSVTFGVQTAAPGVLDSGFDLLRFMAGNDDRLKGLSKIVSKFIPE